MHLCSIFDRTQIFWSHDVKIRKQDPFHSRKRAYSRIQSNSEVYFLQEKITLEIFLLNQTHPMSRAWFHQVINLIKSNLRFCTRLSMLIWSNWTYVSILGCLFIFLFKVLTHVSALDYPFSISFQGFNPHLNIRLSFFNFFSRS